MDDELTLEQIREIAANAGMPLSEEDAGKLLSGANRTRKMVTKVRELVNADLEPGGVFRAEPPQGSGG
jgi:hypothetical protein